MGRRRSIRVAAIAGFVGLLLAAGSVAAASTAGVTIRETNNLYHFSPKTTYVNVGGTVTWTNGTDAPHTVTSDSGSELASGTIGPGTTFNHAFATTGTFAYHCTIHTYMVGSVTVLAAGVLPPATDTLSTATPRSHDPGIGPGLLVLAGLAGGILALRRFRRTA
jgi:plastocyanin